MKRLAVCFLVTVARLAAAGDEMGASVTAPTPSVAGPAEAILSIALKPEAPVRGTWVTLGDVADLAGPEASRLDELKAIQLAHAPMPGAERLMNREQVLKRLHAMGVTERVQFDPAAETCRVTALVKPLPGGALVKFGHDFLAGKVARPDAQITIEDPETPRALTIPDADVNFWADVSGRRLAGLVPVSIEAWSQGKRVARVLLSYRVRTVAPVAVLTKAVEPGMVLGEADLTTESRDLTGLPEDALTATATLIGLRVIRPLPAGAIIRRDAVAQALQVKRGSQVTLIARVGTVTAKAMAQSKDDGANGDVITVVNLDSKRLLKARVVEPGTVEAVMP